MEYIDLSSEPGNKPIREIAYENLKHAIVVGDIPAGARIVETDFSERMHISRTPLREALRKLERDGLVEYLPHRGVVVRAFSFEDVREIYTIRNALEMLTFPAIIENATDEDIAELRAVLAQMDPLVEKGLVNEVSPLAREFHTRLTETCGRKRLIRAIETQDEYIRRFSAISIAHEDRRPAAHEEHHQLVDFVEQRDLAAFTDLMQKHIERSMETCLAALQEIMDKKNKKESSK